MNPIAIELYASNGIDITKEYLECAVCAQHNNGGLMGNIWWESNLKHFFPAGEINGSFGVYRPGGSALNATQTGGRRAAQYIARHYNTAPDIQAVDCIQENVTKIFEFIDKITKNPPSECEVPVLKAEVQQNMSTNGAHIRSLASAEKGIAFCLDRLAKLENELSVTSLDCLPEVFKTKNILLTQLAYLHTIAKYIQDGGQSRGSYLVTASEAMDADIQIDSANSSRALITEFGCDLSVKCRWEDIRPIPEEDNWFENVWRKYRDGEVFK